MSRQGKPNWTKITTVTVEAALSPPFTTTTTTTTIATITATTAFTTTTTFRLSDFQIVRLSQCQTVRELLKNAALIWTSSKTGLTGGESLEHPRLGWIGMENIWSQLNPNFIPSRAPTNRRCRFSWHIKLTLHEMKRNLEQWKKNLSTIEAMDLVLSYCWSHDS